MKKSVFIIFFLLTSSLPCFKSNAKNELFKIDVLLTPSTNFDQIIHDKTYTFNVSIKNIAFDLYDQVNNNTLKTQYSDNFTLLLGIKWMGKGSYDYGNSSAGYQTNIDYITMNAIFISPSINQSSYITFNYTFLRDGFDLGIKPYETVIITISADVHYQEYEKNIILKEKTLGEKITGWSKSYVLIDKTKIAYISGKLNDLSSELKLLSTLPGTTTINTNLYLGMFEEMKSKFEVGDYLASLDVYEDYEDKDRYNLIKSLINETNSTLLKAEKIKKYLKEIDLWKTNYELLENKYVNLQSTYQKKLIELDSLKQDLTTAITGIFLTAILFLFIGTRLAKRED